MVSGKGVSIRKDSVRKKFFTRKKYENEKMIYQMNLPYVPKLKSFDDKNMVLVMENKCCKRLLDVPRQERARFNDKVKKLFLRFHKDTGYYHNDFFPLNIIVDKNDNLFLIDFEMIDPVITADKKKQDYLNSISINRRPIRNKRYS